MHEQPIDIHTMSFSLWRQALSGDSEGALRALERMDLTELTVWSADLLARLYVRAGRLAEARALWQRILQADPNYSPAVKALHRLDSPWLLRAVARKYSLLFGLGVLLLFALYGLGMCLLGDKGVSFALMGMATVLAVLGIYLAGLFGWVYVTAETLFGFGRSTHSPRTRRGRDVESLPGYSNASARRHRR